MTDKSSPVGLRINGSPYEVDVDARLPLLWVLREELGLVGTKYGCGIGQCGACTVLMDGEPVRSCTVPLLDVGRRTVESHPRHQTAPHTSSLPIHIPNLINVRTLFFHHMPKAGGSSIRSVLNQQFDAARIAPVFENNTHDHAANGGHYGQFRGFDYYAGHYGVDVFDTVADGHLPLSNFREPVSRVYSLYRYFRDVDVSNDVLARREYTAVRLAKAGSFAAFVFSDDEIVLTYISNQQTRQLTSSPWEWRTDLDLDAAKARVDGLAWFHVCERPALSVRWLNDVLGLQEIPTENVSATRASDDDVTDRTTQRILELNRYDVALYEYALERIERIAFQT